MPSQHTALSSQTIQKWNQFVWCELDDTVSGPELGILSIKMINQV